MARTSSSTRRTCSRTRRRSCGAARAVAAAAHRAGARLVHLSTDLVFDGEQGAPYDEDADPRPVSAYGAAKLEAERARRARPSGGAARADVAPLREARAAGGARARATASSSSPTRSAARPSSRSSRQRSSSSRQLDVSGPLHVAAAEASPATSSAGSSGRGRAATRTRSAARRRRAGRARNVALDSSRAAGLLETRLRGAAEASRRNRPFGLAACYNRPTIFTGSAKWARGPIFFRRNARGQDA